MSALNRFRKVISEKSENYKFETKAPKDLSNFDLIINASPLGMFLDDQLPGDLDTLKPGSYVGDCVTNFDETNFLKMAKAKGAITVSGADMAKGQLSSILDFFGIT